MNNKIVYSYTPTIILLSYALLKLQCTFPTYKNYNTPVLLIKLQHSRHSLNYNIPPYSLNYNTPVLLIKLQYSRPTH